MTTGETFISLLLIVIAYFLYHIAKQLSYLTGKRLKISFMQWGGRTQYPLRKTRKEEPPEKLPN